MELVPGEDLRGPVPVEDAAAIARQIADALEAAHEKGIVHRDLKPANIKITPDGQVKVLDFGLAKAMEENSADISNSPTLSIAATRAGAILGTASYMSPEQAKGKSVDARADVWAYGCVYYELLTGKRAFPGDSAIEAMAAVISKEPDWSLLPPGSPTELLKLCLRKDPKQRLRHIGDSNSFASVTAGSTILAESAAATPAKGAVWPAMTALFALLAIVASIAAGVLWRESRPKPKPLQRFSVEPSPDVILDSSRSPAVALSPDGTRIAFCGKGADGQIHVFLRSLDQTSASLVANSIPLGTSSVVTMVFSPDSQSLAFWGDGKLRTMPVAGGAATVLAELSGGIGVDWAEDGYIYFPANIRSPIMRVPSTGGAITPVTELRKNKDEVTHRWPHVTGSYLVFTSHSVGGNYENADIEIQSLKTGARKTLYHGGYNGRYVETGHLLFSHQGILYAVTVDPERMAVTGQPIPVLDDVDSRPSFGGVQLAVSASGTAVYVPGKNTSFGRMLYWLDSNKKSTPIGPRGDYSEFSLSPDGKRFALTALTSSNRELLVYDWERDVMSRLTLAGATAHHPAWTPDGKHIIYNNQADKVVGFYCIRADGSGEPILLQESTSSAQSIPSFTPDGTRMVFNTGGHVWTLSLDWSDPDRPKAGKAELVLKTSMNTQVESGPTLSPDGHWLAYATTTTGSGARDIIVRPFPPSPGSGQWQVSTVQGNYPFWSKSGGLFYVSAERQIMSVPYTVRNGVFQPEKPKEWSASQAILRDTTPVISPDGKRIATLFVPLEAEAEKPPTHVTFLLNFFDELQRKAPVKK